MFVVAPSHMQHKKVAKESLIHLWHPRWDSQPQTEQAGVEHPGTLGSDRADWQWDTEDPITECHWPARSGIP